MNLPIFYLKINTNSDFAVACFEHWVKIVEAFGTDYYIVCDNKELQKRVTNKENSDKFIPSSVEARKLLHKIIEPCWLNTGTALFTPFLHAKENEFETFFNIDADDTVMCASPEICAKALKKAGEYADSTDIDCFGLDMHSIALERSYPHWTFGVTYTKTNDNYIQEILAFKENDENYVSRKKELIPLNLDEIFSQLGKIQRIKTQIYYIENLYFRHADFCILYYHNRLLRFKEAVPFLKLRWHIGTSELEEGIYIPEQFIQFDTGVTQQECLDFLAQNSVLSNFKERKAYGNIDSIKMRIKQKSKKLILFGAGRDAIMWLFWLGHSNIDVHFFCDNSQNLWGTEIEGLKVISFEQLKELSKQEELYVLITTSKYHNEVKDQISTLDVEILNEPSVGNVGFRETLAKYFKLFRNNLETPIYLYRNYEHFINQTNFFKTMIGYDLMSDIAGFVEETLDEKNITSTNIPGYKCFSLDEIPNDAFIIVNVYDTDIHSITRKLLEIGKIHNYNYTTSFEFDCIYKRYLFSAIRRFQNAYNGERCFIIGNGPSLNLADIEILHKNNEFVLVSNNFYKWFDKTAFRPDFYFLADALDVNVEEFAAEDNINFIADICFKINKNVRNLYYFEQSPWMFYDNYPYKPFFSEDIALTFASGSITHIMLQMAVNMGFTEIYLIGMDNDFPIVITHDGDIIVNDTIHHHFYDTKSRFAVYRKDMFEQAYRYAREYCDKKGIKIRNATRGGKLEIFERVSFDGLFRGSQNENNSDSTD